MISAPQTRAARGLLNWSQRELASRANVAPRTLALFEQGKRLPYERTVERIRSVFEEAGVAFVEDGGSTGVLLRKGPSQGSV